MKGRLDENVSVRQSSSQPPKKGSVHSLIFSAYLKKRFHPTKLSFCNVCAISINISHYIARCSCWCILVFTISMLVKTSTSETIYTYRLCHGVASAAYFNLHHLTISVKNYTYADVSNSGWKESVFLYRLIGIDMHFQHA